MDREIQLIIRKAKETQQLSKEELVSILACESSRASALFAAADQVRQQYVGDEVHLRGIIEFSNCCQRNCRYCGLRRGNPTIKRYRMSADEIYEAALAACRLGYRTVVLQSGEDSLYDADMIAAIVKRLKKLDLAVTLSCGERPYEQYLYWRRAGADRYLLKHETANTLLYSKLHPDMSFAERRRCLADLRQTGYQVGSGCMVGLPGQTPEILAEDLLYLKELDVEMAGIGPFIPNPHTPLAGAAPGTVEMTLKMIALTRLLLPQAHLPVTTALSTIDAQGRQKALRNGANVIMPNVTPKRFRSLYAIYPNKDFPDANQSNCRQCVSDMLNSLGRTVAQGQGHSPKPEFSRDFKKRGEADEQYS